MAVSTKERSGDACSAMFCSNARWKTKDVCFFRFPKDEARCKLWVQNCRRQNILRKTAEELHKGGYMLCSKHFEEKQFTNWRKERLNWNAVPTIFDIPNPPPRRTPKRPPPRNRTATVQPPLKKPRTLSGAEISASSSDSSEIIQAQNDIDEDVQTSSETKQAQAAVSDHTEKSHDLKRKLKNERNKVYRRKRALQEQQHSSAKKLKVNKKHMKEEVAKKLYEFLPEHTARFVETQLHMVSKHGKGRRWSEEQKLLALSLYHASRKAYLILNKIFVLPSFSLLKQMIRNVQIYPGFSDRIISALSDKLSGLEPNSSLCSLVFDEMAIKEKVVYNAGRDEVEGFEDFGSCGGKTHFVANHALVFLVRGIVQNWKQPVGYALSSGPIDASRLHILLKECLDKLTTAGLVVKCIVADQGSNNQKLFKTYLNVSEKRPFFEFKSKKVYAFHDPPHLLKNIRNNFKKCGFKVDDAFISWNHVVDFYHFDRQNEIRMAPKLTNKHIFLPPFSPLSVRLAAQVLSRSVAVGISCMARFTQDREPLQTARFIERFDTLFNAFNSRNLKSHQPMGHAMSEKSGHIAVLEETLTWLDSVRPSSRKSLPCLTGWKTAIKGLLFLWKDLSENYGVSFLMTSRINQDCIENLFSRIRGNVAQNSNPSATEFRTYMRRAMVDNIFHHSKGNNCEEDLDRFLLTLTQQRVAACVTDADLSKSCEQFGHAKNSTVGQIQTSAAVQSSAVCQSPSFDQAPFVDEVLAVGQAPVVDQASVVNQAFAVDQVPVVDQALAVGQAPFADQTANQISPLYENQEQAVNEDEVRIATDVMETGLQQQDLDDEMRTLLLISTPSVSTDMSTKKAREGVLTYISGFIAKKLLSSGVCLSCQSMLKGHLTCAEHQQFLADKQFQGCTSGLTVPSEALVQLVRKLEHAFSQHIHHILVSQMLMARLTVLLGDAVTESSLICSQGKCALKSKAVKLFCSIRVHFFLKQSSLALSQKGPRNKKILKLIK